MTQSSFNDKWGGYLGALMHELGHVRTFSFEITLVLFRPFLTLLSFFLGSEPRSASCKYIFREGDIVPGNLFF